MFPAVLTDAIEKIRPTCESRKQMLWGLRALGASAILNESMKVSTECTMRDTQNVYDVGVEMHRQIGYPERAVLALREQSQH